MQTKLYISIAVFVGVIGGYAGQKYEQSKASTLLAQEIEEFGNLFSIVTGSPDQKPQSEEEYLTLTPTPKSEKLETTSDKDRFKSQQYKRYSDLRTAAIEFCGGRF